MELKIKDIVAMRDELSGEDAEGQIVALSRKDKKALVRFGDGHAQLWLAEDQLRRVRGPACRSCAGTGKETTRGKAADGTPFTIIFERACPLCDGSGKAAA